jgi:2,5-furandicarboxylate decarboxylase 1
VSEKCLVQHQDLREYLALLEKQGGLRRTKRPADPGWEMTAVLGKLEEEGDLSAVLFEEVPECPGWRVVGNLFAERRRLAIALNVSEEELLPTFLKRINAPIPARTVTTGPIKDHILTGKDADLDRLPLVHHHEKDAGRYLSSGVCISRDPDTGILDMGVYRFMVKDGKTLVPSLTQTSNISDIFRRSEESGKPLEVAIIPGVDPLVMLAASYGAPLGEDELAIAGGLRGEPLEVVPCETVDLLVPALAEMCIEAEIHPGERLPEAPFADQSLTYSRVKSGPRVTVRAITHRENPIHQFIFSGHRDVLHLMSIIFEATIYDAVRRVVPTVRAVHVPPSGAGFHCYVSMNRQPTTEGFETGEGKTALLAVLGAAPYIKLAVVVDDDINVFDEEEILWAIGTRFQPIDAHTGEPRYFVVPGAKGASPDPSAFHKAYPSSKLALDCTVRVDLPEEMRRQFWKAEVSGKDRIKLEDYFDNPKGSAGGAGK